MATSSVTTLIYSNLILINFKTFKVSRVPGNFDVIISATSFNKIWVTNNNFFCRGDFIGGIFFTDIKNIRSINWVYLFNFQYRVPFIHKGKYSKKDNTNKRPVGHVPHLIHVPTLLEFDTALNQKAYNL